MRILMAIIVLFTFQLTADAEETADFASSAAPSKSWGKSQDMFVTPVRNEAKVKALIRDLLGDERPAAPAPAEENSGQTEAID